MSHQMPEHSSNDQYGQYDQNGRYGWDAPSPSGAQVQPSYAQAPYGQPAYAQQPYQQQYGQWGAQTPANPEATSHATTALILGIVGIVISFLGIVLGPLGLSQAKKARAGGADATAGRVLSIIATVIGGLTWLSIFLYFAFLIVLLAVSSGS